MRSKRPGFDAGACWLGDAEAGAADCGCAGAACSGAGFTRPRNSYSGRSRTSRTSMMVSGDGMGGGSGELALKLSAGMSTVYIGSLPDVEGGGMLSVFRRGGATGEARAAISTGGAAWKADADAAGAAEGASR